MNHTTTSVGRVIDKIYRDLRPNHPNWETDAIEWAGEALAHIGSGTQYEDKTATLTIVDHAASLPNDFVQPREVFKVDGESYSPLGMIDTTGLPSFLPSQVFDIPDGFALQGDQLHTSFSEGTVSIVYLGFSLDDDGYPKIPDDPSYLDSILWYIIMKMMVGGWNHPNPEISFGKAEDLWQKYCSQARQKSKMPTVLEFDAFMRRWVRMANTQDPRDPYPQGPSGKVYGSKHINRFYQPNF
jgi:hypothetical protein